jgi:hypothetical protein
MICKSTHAIASGRLSISRKVEIEVAPRRLVSRSKSVPSMRRVNWPLAHCAKSQLQSAVRT